MSGSAFATGQARSGGGGWPVFAIPVQSLSTEPGLGLVLLRLRQRVMGDDKAAARWMALAVQAPGVRQDGQCLGRNARRRGGQRREWQTRRHRNRRTAFSAFPYGPVRYFGTGASCPARLEAQRGAHRAARGFGVAHSGSRKAAKPPREVGTYTLILCGLCALCVNPSISRRGRRGGGCEAQNFIL